MGTTRFDDPEEFAFYLIGVLRAGVTEKTLTGDVEQGFLDPLLAALHDADLGFDPLDMDIHWPVLLIKALTAVWADHELPGNPWDILQEMAADHAADPAALERDWSVLAPPEAGGPASGQPSAPPT